MNMSSILDLNDDLKALFNMTDVDAEVLQDTAQAISGTREEKFDGLAYVIESDQKEIEWLKDKIQKLQKELKARKNHEANLKDYMIYALEDAGVKQLQTGNHLLKTRKGQPSVNVVDESKVPAQYIVHTESMRVDKKTLRDVLKQNEVPGVELQQKRSVTIK